MKGDVVEIHEGRSHTCVDYILVGRLFLCMVQRGGEALLRELIAEDVRKIVEI